MAPIANDTARPVLPDRVGRPDPLGRLVQVTLAIYLAPAIAIVLAIGGASILAGGASRLAGRLAIGTRPARPIDRHPRARGSIAGPSGRTRVGR